MIDRIYCKNFRRLAEADIELADGITVLVGNNGTGKSTLVEAAVFNLFGKVRSGTKKESVRRTGADPDDPTRTAVDFTLLGGTEGERHYRCRRWYTKKMSAMASLRAYTPEEYAELVKSGDPFDDGGELGTDIASGATGVTSAVEDLLGISYDGFMASFVAQQKELNSLASLTQENRKKFFLDLLGYSKLDDLRPDLSKRLKGVQQAIDIIEKQNLSAPEIEKELARARKDKDKLDARVAKGRRKLEEAKEKRDALSAECEELSGVATKVRQYLEEGVARKKELDALVAENEEHAARIASDEKKSEGYDENSPLSSRLDEARKSLDAMTALRRLVEERDRIAGGASVRRKELAEARKTAEALRKKTEKEPDLDAAQKAVADAKASVATKESELKAAQRDEKEFADLISSVESGDVAKCPTCGTDISSESGKAHLSGELEDATARKASAAEALAKARQALDDASRQMAAVRASARTYNADLASLQKSEQKAEMLSASVSETEEQISAMDAEIRQAGGKAPSPEAMHAAETLVASLGADLKRENEMKAAFYRLKQARQAKEMNDRRIAQITAELDEKREFCKKNREVERRYAKKRDERDKATETYDGYADLLAEIEKQRGAAGAAIEALEGNLRIARQQSEQMIGLKSDVETYTGAKQVVEYLRKTLPTRIAPRLAVEASRLLDIATAGAYTMLEIDDAYEVYVYTDTEVRPISQMSGGETDTVSLCIRIAIAKMILEATGITEQTFILDEIFGALDDGRRENTCEVLRNIGGQLKKILCITHIDEIKDMADRVYVVEMDENGVSHVREQIDAGIEWNTLMAKQGNAAVVAGTQETAGSESGEAEEESE